MRFQDKFVLVTGSSRNTGLGIAEAFLREGATVFINGSTPESTATAGETLKNKGFDRFVELPCDIGDVPAVATMFETIRRHTDRLDVLVNNAAHLGIGPTFVEVPMETFTEVFRINLLGTIHVSQQAARMMIPHENGAIVHVGTNTSIRAIRNRVAYCTSKGGIDALTLSMAVDLAPCGIRVNCVAPGYIFTERWETLSEEHKARRRLNTPLGSEANYDDIAEAIMFLASDAASNICGVRLVVDGGCTAQHMPIDVDI